MGIFTDYFSRNCNVSLLENKKIFMHMHSDLILFLGRGKRSACPLNVALPPSPEKWLRKPIVLDSQNVFSTSSLISPSFQGDPTIFHKGIFLKPTPDIKNCCALKEYSTPSFLLLEWESSNIIWASVSSVLYTIGFIKVCVSIFHPRADTLFSLSPPFFFSHR